MAARAGEGEHYVRGIGVKIFGVGPASTLADAAVAVRRISSAPAVRPKKKIVVAVM